MPSAVSKPDPASDGVLRRIKAPTLLILMTADRGQLQSVDRARQYQALIPNSRLVVLRSDGHHIAASNASYRRILVTEGIRRHLGDAI
jgi:pimeloyl-ACP methyl ester carboxylesterase